MGAFALGTLLGYPCPPGNKLWAPLTVQGPTLYAPIVAGTAPAGPTAGQLVTAAAFGMQYLEHVMAMGSTTGLYRVEIFFSPSQGLATGAPRGLASVRLQWILSATGAEAAAVDLSAQAVQLWAIGG